VHLFTRLILVAAVVIASLAALAGSASATMLKGQVVGSPYSSDVRTAIPVLLSRVSAKRAHLDSPVGVFIVPRKATIPTPDGPVIPARLRPGDRLQAAGRVGGAARSATYFRLGLRNVVVKRRSKTPSNDELAAAVAQLQQAVAALQNQLNGLANYVNAGFASLQGQLDSLRKDLNTLRDQVTALVNQVNDLGATVDRLKTELTEKLGGLPTDLSSLIAGLQSKVQGILDALNGVSMAALNSDNLLTDPYGTAASLKARVKIIGDLVNSLLSGVPPGTIAGLLSTVDGTLNQVVGQLQGLDGILGTADDTVAGATGQLQALQNAVTGPGGLTSQVGTLEGQVGTLNPAGGNDVTSQLTLIKNNLTGFDTSLVNASAGLGNPLGGLGTQLTTVSNTLSTATGRIDGLCTGLTTGTVAALPTVGSTLVTALTTGVGHPCS
jgi:conjugal transfer/entry exclusion protein